MFTMRVQFDMHWQTICFYFMCRDLFICLLWAPVLQLFDGHNGTAAAVYTKENLLNNVLSAIPTDVSRDEWLAALPRALVAGFTKTDKDFQDHGTDRQEYHCDFAWYLNFDL